MGANSKQIKELAKNILAVVKNVAPELSKVAKDVPFEIVITNDKKGIGIEMSIEWDPMRDAEENIEVLEATAKDFEEEADRLEKRCSSLRWPKPKATSRRLPSIAACQPRDSNMQCSG